MTAGRLGDLTGGTYALKHRSFLDSVHATGVALGRRVALKSYSKQDPNRKDIIMKTNLRGRDFISTQEWSKEELETVLHLAFDLTMKWGLDLPTRLLEDNTLFTLLLF